MSQNQENPDNYYEKWQQEHDQRRRAIYDDSETNTYEYENNSSFTATPQRDYSSSTQSIFGSSETTSQYSQISPPTGPSQSEYQTIQSSGYPDYYVQQTQVHIGRWENVLNNVTEYVYFNLVLEKWSNDEPFMFQNKPWDAENTKDETISSDDSLD
jgi:hypothetical protein